MLLNTGKLKIAGILLSFMVTHAVMGQSPNIFKIIKTSNNLVELERNYNDCDAFTITTTASPNVLKTTQFSHYPGEIKIEITSCDSVVFEVNRSTEFKLMPIDDRNIIFQNKEGTYLKLQYVFCNGQNIWIPDYLMKGNQKFNFYYLVPAKNDLANSQ